MPVAAVFSTIKKIVVGEDWIVLYEYSNRGLLFIVSRLAPGVGCLVCSTTSEVTLKAYPRVP